MLAAESIVKKYKRRNHVLNGVSLRAAPGEIVGIAGENGSGKSTLLSILTAVIKPDSGSVTVEGEDIFRNIGALRQYVGYVPQDNSLFDNLSTMDNLKLWASAYNTDWKNAEGFLFPEAVPEGERRAFLKKSAGHLSGGMKKRLSIALSLMHRPRYLLMDEPSAGLDISFKWTLTELMKDMKARGNTVLFTSHHPDELMLCDRIYVLRGGAFIMDGSPKSVMDEAGERDFGEALRKLITGRG